MCGLLRSLSKMVRVRTKHVKMIRIGLWRMSTILKVAWNHTSSVNIRRCLSNFS